MSDDGRETMTHEWQERLSEYLDGELTGDERRACDVHLAACAECAAVLGELRRVVERASGLADELPAYDLWPVIRAQLDAPPMTATPAIRRTPRLAGAGFTWPRLAAAGLTAVALAGTLLWAARAPRVEPRANQRPRRERVGALCHRRGRRSQP
jgi:anti-sigma factor RsiW